VVYTLKVQYYLMQCFTHKWIKDKQLLNESLFFTLKMDIAQTIMIIKCMTPVDQTHDTIPWALHLSKFISILLYKGQFLYLCIWYQNFADMKVSNEIKFSERMVIWFFAWSDKYRKTLGILVYVKHL